ncbi:MAG: protein kinase [Planctomycetes bacterium]|nr:protein kinase [Planctomycetota bacterium]
MITSQELAFVRLAMRQRLLSVNVVQEAVERKKWDAPDRPITEILVDMGVLGPDQATRLKRQLEGAAPPKEAPRMRATQVGKDPAAREDPDGPLAGLPSRIGPYQLVRMLGAGAMGAVYHARHVELERDVALKLLQSEGAPTARAIQRFKREARLAARLDHPNIVRVYEAGHEAGQHFIAMDMVRGRSVGELLTLGEVTVRRAVHVMRKTAEAVAYAHEQGVIHRDLKPANILVDDRSGEPRVTDFGLATLSEPDEDDKLTRTGAAVGTPAYMAPEQVRGRVDEIDRRTDVYALGATLYEMLTGAPPFDAATFLELAKRICDEDPVAPRKKNPAVPAPVETVCLKALEKDPAARYQSAADMAADLAAFLDDAPIRAQPPGPVERARRWARRRPAFVAGALGFAAVVGAGLGFFLSLPGTLELSTVPAGAAVLLDGRELLDERGQTLLTPPEGALRLEVAAGAHRLRFRLPGFLDQAVGVDVVRVGHGETLKLSGTLVSTRGLLRVETEQPGGTVAVFTPDGAPCGEGPTPFLASLEAGPYRIVVGAPGGWVVAPGAAAERIVTVPSGGVEEKVPVPVVRDVAALRIEADPENVTVRWARDGSSRVAPAELPGAGEHEVELSKAGYLPQRLRVTVPPGGRVERRVTLQPLAAWRRPLDGRLLGPPLVRDVDGDGAPDLVVLEDGRDGPRLALLPGAGHTRARFRVDTTATAILDAEDVDGDGVLDLLLGGEQHLELRDGRTGRLVARAAGVHGPSAVVLRAPNRPTQVLVLEDERPRLLPISLAATGAPLRGAPGRRARPALVPRGVRLGAFAARSFAVFPAAGAALVWDTEAPEAAPRRVALAGVTPTSVALPVAVDRERDPWVVLVPEEGPAWLLDPQGQARYQVGEAGARLRRPSFALADRPWLLLTDDARGRTRAFALGPEGAREGQGAVMQPGAVFLRAGSEPAVAALGLGPAAWSPTGDLFAPAGDGWVRVDAGSTDAEPWASRDDEPVVADADGDGLPEVLLPAPDGRAVVALDPTPGRVRWRVRQPLPQTALVAALEAPAAGDLLLAAGERIVGRAGEDGRVLLDQDLGGHVVGLTAARGGDRAVYAAARVDGGDPGAAALTRWLPTATGGWEQVWKGVRRPASGLDALPLDLDGDKVFDVLCGGPLAVLRASDGGEVWAGRAGVQGAGSTAAPRLLPGAAPLCVGPKDPGREKAAPLLAAHDPLGKLIWEVPLAVRATLDGPWVNDPARLILGEEREGVLVVVTERRVMALRRTDGSESWSLDLPGVVGGLFVGGTPPRLVLTRAPDELVCLDVGNGTALWARRLPEDRPGGAPSPPAWLPPPRPGAPGLPRPSPGDPEPLPVVAVVAPSGVVVLVALDDGALLGERRSPGATLLPWLVGVPTPQGGFVVAATEDERLLALPVGPQRRPRLGRRERVREQARRIDLGGAHVRPALGDLQALVREDPADASALAALARAHLALGEHAPALEAARAASRVRQRLPEALRAQAEATFALGRPMQEEVEPLLHQLALVDPPQAARVAADLAAQGGVDASRFLRRVRELAPHDPSVRRLLGLERLRSIGKRVWNATSPDELADVRRVAAEARAELLLSLTRHDDPETRAAAIVALLLERRATAVFATRRPSRADAERLALLNTLLGGLVPADLTRAAHRPLELARSLALTPDDGDIDALSPVIAELVGLRPQWEGALQGIGSLRP